VLSFAPHYAYALCEHQTDSRCAITNSPAYPVPFVEAISKTGYASALAQRRHRFRRCSHSRNRRRNIQKLRRQRPATQCHAPPNELGIESRFLRFVSWLVGA
jgi:hypothetical protein